jgi:hypothetical protein
MIVHFKTTIEAIDNLTSMGFEMLDESGHVYWKPGYKASIHPIRGSEMVMVAYSEAQGRPVLMYEVKGQ